MKAQIVVDVMSRLSGVTQLRGHALADALVCRDIGGDEPAGSGLGTRTRVRYAVDADGHLAMRRRGSHDLVQVASCPLGTPGITSVAQEFRDGEPGLDVEFIEGDDGMVVVRTAADDYQQSVHREIDGLSWQLEAGGFWQTPASTHHLLVRSKEDHDGAEPGGNSVAALALLRISAICARKDWHEAATKTLRLFAQKLHQMPHAVPHLLLALDFAQQEPKRVALVGDWTCGSTETLLRTANSVFEPHRVVLGNHGPVDPFVRGLPVNEEFTQAFCCTGSACQPPTRDRKKLKAFLEVVPVVSH